ncbi:MAG: DeoR/GlpR family DNA-binding transcription regulator [Bacillota bacterium]
MNEPREPSEPTNGRLGAAGPTARPGGGNLLGAERRSRILSILRQQGAVRVSELAGMLGGVSPVTIRKDLRELQRQGLLQRSRGGAVMPEGGYEIAFERRSRERLHAKQALAQAAAAVVQDGETILVDSGSTALALAHAIMALNRRVTVATPSPHLALLFSRAGGLPVVMPGGLLLRESMALVGPEAVEGLSRLYADKLFLAASALDVEAGLFDTSPLIAETKRAMIRAAAHVYLIADSSKMNRRSVAHVAGWDAIDTWFCDDELAPSVREALERKGVRVVAAPSKGAHRAGRVEEAGTPQEAHAKGGGSGGT